MAEVARWTSEDADVEGFVPFELLRRRAAGGVGPFVRDHPVPALVLEPGDLLRKGGGERPSDGVQLLTTRQAGLAAFRYLDRAAFLAKRPGVRYGHLISIGRSSTNDIVLAVDSVSKMHGYFTLDSGRWAYTDHRSTNGSKLNGQPMPASEPRTLLDGDKITVGLEIVLHFFEPDSLYRRLTTTP